MDLLTAIMLLLADAALSLAFGAFCMRQYAWKDGYRTARGEQLQELEQWKIEALSLRLQVAGVQTMF